MNLWLSTVVTGGLLIAGLPAAMVIMTLVEVAKRIGLPRHYAPLVAIGLGVGTTMLLQATVYVPWLSDWLGAIGVGVGLGLSACGLYSGSKAMIVRRGRGGSGHYLELDGGEVVDGRAQLAAGGPPSGKVT